MQDKQRYGLSKGLFPDGVNIPSRSCNNNPIIFKV